MSNTKHTPGPWSYSDHASPRITNVECDIARVEALPGSENHSEVRGEVIANARLIAAAPDLLAALREVSLCFGTGEASEEWWAEQHDNYVPEGRNSVDCRNDVLERARAVIAKAEQS